MSTAWLIFIVVSAVALLLLMVLRFRLNAFIALLLTAMYAGILAGMPLPAILKSMQKGMGDTLGFVAVVVGLGAIFGQMLESSGGATALAHTLIARFGQKKASWAMVITGFIVAIPVFFDVGFIILVPLVYSLARDSKKSLLYYGIPLLAGLAVTHSFIPPTPGPVAVADILSVPLGRVILFGFIMGIPTAILAGPVFGKYISSRIYVEPPAWFTEDHPEPESPARGEGPSFRLILLLIGIPILLILGNTLTATLVDKHLVFSSWLTNTVIFLGHPFSALIIATLLAIWLLGLRRGMERQEILSLTTRAMGPAGIIILVTGAGGVLKQVLVDSGIGVILARHMAASSFSPILLGWLLAAVVRVAQGSSTVAMITAAGILAPVVSLMHLSDARMALLVIAIASGATLLSHVNDSGFWLVGKYFGLTEKQTLQSWTVMETLIALSGLGLTLLAGLFV